jgi:hypothetical protein
MRSLAIFVAACGGIALIGFIVSKLTGARAFYLEDWAFEPGETTLWRDDASDTYLIPRYGQAKFMSFARPRRGFVVVTNQRILAGQRPLFGKKRMVQYVLILSPDEQSQKLDGGLFTRGYQTIALCSTIEAHADEKKPYVDLTAMGATNLERIRIFTDQAATFRLPTP